MRYAILLLSLICLGCSFSGGDQELQPDQVLVRTETLIDDADMRVYRVYVTFRGSKEIRTIERGDSGGGETTVYVQNRPKEAATTIPVTLSAVEIPGNGGDSVIRRLRTCVQVNESAGPGVRDLQKHESMQADVRLLIEDGVYSSTRPVKICQLFDQIVELQVTPVKPPGHELSAEESNSGPGLTGTGGVSEPVKADNAIDGDHQ